MIDFAAARRMMVDCQVRTSDVTDLRVIAAMLDVPRERFLPPSSAALAYSDLDVPVSEEGRGRSRRLLKPMVLAKLLQAAQIEANDRVLDVGGATGYSAAVLARLAGSVVSLEEDAELARRAWEALAVAGAGGVEIAVGPLTEGWTAGAPYDVILLNGAIEVAPRALMRQLKEGGRLVGIEGRAPGKAMLYSREAGAGEIGGRPIFDADAALLPGFARPAAFVF
jgi:protein-L-isoaspartate(D-aspartate) O-methyltransferase